MSEKSETRDGSEISIVRRKKSAVRKISEKGRAVFGGCDGSHFCGKDVTDYRVTHENFYKKYIFRKTFWSIAVRGMCFCRFIFIPPKADSFHAGGNNRNR